MSTIVLSGLHKRFGATHTLRGIELAIDEGEFVVFVGPSGCGKSTLLRLIAGLEGASEGRIEIGGRDVSFEPASRRGVAMVFQSYALYPHMTVRQNLAFGMAMRGVPKATIATKLDRAVALLKLEPYLERRPGELSGGQCQRVAIGRALVQEPRVFLFDEPLSNLDAELRLHLRLEIAALHQHLGRTMVYVTHDQVEAMTLAERIVVLRDGLVEQVGSPLALYTNPANRFVAGFIGSPAMNLLPATVTSASTVRYGEAVLEVPAMAGVTSGQPCTLGLRPEHLELQDNGPLALNVRMVERLGSSTVLHGDLSGQASGSTQGLPGTAASLLVPRHVAAQAGSRLRCAAHPGEAQVFEDAAVPAGRRLSAARPVPAA
jgi:ABC-type sugar transport system ATPase subunit